MHIFKRSLLLFSLPFSCYTFPHLTCFFLTGSVLKPKNVGSRRNLPSIALKPFFPSPLYQRKGQDGHGGWRGESREERKKKSVADPCSSKTSNKITSKESLAVSHNMVKLEIAGNQLN